MQVANQSNVLDYLKDFMLTDILINKFTTQKIFLHSSNMFISKNSNASNGISNNINNKNANVEKLNNKEIKHCHNSIDKNTPEIFSPSEKDKLFWCFFVLVNGFEEYELSKKSTFKCEKESKILAVEKLDSIKDKLKELKLKKTEIQDELVNQNMIGIKALYALCIINKINLLYVKDRLLYEVNVGVDNEFKVIINEKGNVYIPYNLDDEKLAFYRENCWNVENIQKPLNAFSGYSLNELQTICKKLDISLHNENGNKKKTKKELYENILTKL
jgi:hypothetical protein